MKKKKHNCRGTMTTHTRLSPEELERIKGKKRPGKLNSDSRWLLSEFELTEDIDRLLLHIAALEQEIKWLK